MIKIDGSLGEGGGQVLRSSLTLSILTQTPFELFNIRAGRKKSGLRQQHLTAVLAAAEISDATVEGGSLGSRRIKFYPKKIKSGEFKFKIGTAGSTTLVLQTVLLPLLLADEPSTVTVVGGTHNPKAPIFEFMDEVFVESLNKMGAKISLKLNRYGFFPAGGGEIVAKISPSKLTPISLVDGGDVKSITAKVVSIRERDSVFQSQSDEIKKWLECPVTKDDSKPVGPGNSVYIKIERENCTEIISGVTKRGRPPHIVARVVAQKALKYIEQNSAVGEHLTDQLLIPIVIAGKGEFSCSAPTLHTKTNCEIIEIFTGVKFEFLEKDDFWICLMVENSG
jgi:RNA 3'-terminal phosphate cyclase (ATP)